MFLWEELLESDISKHPLHAMRFLGSKSLSQLPPDTRFAINVRGTRRIDRMEYRLDCIYSGVFPTKSIRINIQWIESPNRIIFYWHCSVNIPLEYVNDPFIIFNFARDQCRTVFCRQWTNASQAELYTIESNSNYNREVGFRPLLYASESWLPILQRL